MRTKNHYAEQKYAKATYFHLEKIETFIKNIKKMKIK